MPAAATPAAANGTAEATDPIGALLAQQADEAANGLSADGVVGDVAIVSPPYNAGEDVLDELVERFARGIRNALGDVGAI